MSPIAINLFIYCQLELFWSILVSALPKIVKMIIYVKKHTHLVERLRSSDNMA